MIVQKEFPDEGEFVIIKITKIMPHGAYCKLTEFNIDAYLPISEVSSGWIKNIHEFIKEGLQDVAKVIFVDRSKRSVDISLKKATSKNKKDKTTEFSLEKRAEGIFNKAIENSKNQEKKHLIIQEIAKVEKTYNDLINDIYEGKDPLSSIKEPDFKKVLSDLVFKSIKPKTYEVAYNIELSTSNTRSGIRLIKEALVKVENAGAEVQYLGAPKYRLVAKGSDYLKAEDKIKEAQRILEQYGDIKFELKSSKAQSA